MLIIYQDQAVLTLESWGRIWLFSILKASSFCQLIYHKLYGIALKKQNVVKFFINLTEKKALSVMNMFGDFKIVWCVNGEFNLIY